MFSKKGQLGNLQGIIMSLVVVGILIGAGFFVLGEFMDQAVDLNVSEATDGINETIDAMDTIPNLLPLVVLIAMVVIILALVFTIPGARSRA